jgi:hypothetical protein
MTRELAINYQLCQDATRCPYVDAGTIIARAKNNFRAAVFSRHLREANMKERYSYTINCEDENL